MFLCFPWGSWNRKMFPFLLLKHQLKLWLLHYRNQSVHQEIWIVRVCCCILWNIVEYLYMQLDPLDFQYINFHHSKWSIFWSNRGILGFILVLGREVHNHRNFFEEEPLWLFRYLSCFLCSMLRGLDLTWIQRRILLHSCRSCIYGDFIMILSDNRVRLVIHRGTWLLFR